MADLVLSSAFNTGQIEPRTEEILIPDHVAESMFADPPKDAKWTIRGLTDVELARLQVEAAKSSGVKKIIEAATKGSDDTANAAMTIMGLSSDQQIPAHLIMHREMVRLGSVNPSLDGQQVLRFFAAYPTFSQELAQKISELTGLGADLGKSAGSTTKKSSKAH